MRDAVVRKNGFFEIAPAEAAKRIMINAEIAKTDDDIPDHIGEKRGHTNKFIFQMMKSMKITEIYAKKPKWT